MHPLGRRFKLIARARHGKALATLPRDALKLALHHAGTGDKEGAPARGAGRQVAAPGVVTMSCYRHQPLPGEVGAESVRNWESPVMRHGCALLRKTLPTRAWPS